MKPYRIPTDPMEALRAVADRLGALERTRFALPVYTADPATPQEGEAWVRSDLGQLCFRVAGVTKRVP